MSSAPTKSGNKSSSKLPFTVETITQYELFQALEPKVKAKICELLTSGKVSPKGNIKRPPNSFMLYRQNRLSELTKHNGGESGENSRPKPLMVKNEWNGSAVEKAEYSALAKHARQEHDARFPGYKYNPIPERKWKAINEGGRKKWFFESLALVSANIVHGCSGTKPCSMDIDEWIRDPANHVYVDNQVLDEVLSSAGYTTRPSHVSRDHSSAQTQENFSFQHAGQSDNSLESNDDSLPCEYTNTTLVPSSGRGADLQPLPFTQSSLPSGYTAGASSRLVTSHPEPSVNPTMEDICEFTQRISSNSQSTPLIHDQPRTVHNQVDPIATNGEPADFMSHPRLPTGEWLTLEVEQTLLGVSNMGVHNLYSGRDSYDLNQAWTHGHPIVTGSEVAIDYTSVSQRSDQDGASNSYSNNPNAEHLYDYPELMKLFLNPFVLGDDEP